MFCPNLCAALCWYNKDSIINQAKDDGKVLEGATLLITCCQKSDPQPHSKAEGGNKLGWEPQVPERAQRIWEWWRMHDQHRDKELLEVMHRGERTPAHSPAERLLCCFRVLHVSQLGKWPCCYDPLLSCAIANILYSPLALFAALSPVKGIFNLILFGKEEKQDWESIVDALRSLVVLPNDHLL